MIRRMMGQRQMGMILGFLLALMLAGCATVQPPLPAGVLAGSVTDLTAEMMTDSADKALIWEGHTEMGSANGQEQCMRLAITPTGEVTFGGCAETGNTAALLPIQAQTWTAIQEQFASMTGETADARLLFQGTGAVEGAAWQRALARWAEFTVAELATGHVSASNRTAMSWWLGQAPNVADGCAHLLVLVHGYAYADIRPCDGGQALAHVEGWLTTAEMEQFDAWFATAAPTYAEDNYLVGQGQQELSDAQIAEVSSWARQVHQRLQAQGAQ